MSASCQRASVLLSAAMDRKLSLRERFSLRFHLVICKYCRRFRRQLGVLRLLVRDYLMHTEADAGDRKLRPEARARIRHALGNSP